MDEGYKGWTRGTRGGRGVRGGDEGYFSSSEEEGEVTEKMAAKGLGEAGSVSIRISIWRKCIPDDLLGKYKRFIRESNPPDPPRPATEATLTTMFESVRVQTGGAKHTTKRPSVSAFLKCKDATKCRLILAQLAFWQKGTITASFCLWCP